MIKPMVENASAKAINIAIRGWMFSSRKTNAPTVTNIKKFTGRRTAVRIIAFL